MFLNEKVAVDLAAERLAADNAAGYVRFDISTRAGGNYLTADISGDLFLWSYGRLVAAGALVAGYDWRIWYKEHLYHSPTTSRHINNFMRGGQPSLRAVGLKNRDLELVDYDALYRLLVAACHRL